MLRHDDVPVKPEPETPSHRSKADSKIRRLASVVNNRSLERLSAAKESNGAMVTAESDEMTLPAVLKTRESPWHEDNLVFSPDYACDV
jgi:hypothetical protein